jgi:hypothetical protein
MYEKIFLDFCKENLNNLDKDLSFFKGIITKKVHFIRDLFERIFIIQNNKKIILIDILEFKIINSNEVLCNINPSINKINTNILFKTLTDFFYYYNMIFCEAIIEQKKIRILFKDIPYNDEIKYYNKCKLLINSYKNKLKFKRNLLIKKYGNNIDKREKKNIETKLNTIIKEYNNKLDFQFKKYFNI